MSPVTVPGTVTADFERYLVPLGLQLPALRNPIAGLCGFIMKP